MVMLVLMSPRLGLGLDNQNVILIANVVSRCCLVSLAARVSKSCRGQTAIGTLVADPPVAFPQAEFVLPVPYCDFKLLGEDILRPIRDEACSFVPSRHRHSLELLRFPCWGGKGSSHIDWWPCTRMFIGDCNGTLVGRIHCDWGREGEG